MKSSAFSIQDLHAIFSMERNPSVKVCNRGTLSPEHLLEARFSFSFWSVPYVILPPGVTPPKFESDMVTDAFFDSFRSRGVSALNSYMDTLHTHHLELANEMALAVVHFCQKGS